MKIQSFTDLQVYKECRKFRKIVSNISKQYFPKNEKFLLTDQIKRSSRSITANIAEGHGRHYYQDNIRFCRIARGSLEETLEHFITAFDENYINKEVFGEIKPQHEKCLMLLNGYIRYLRKSKIGKVDNGV